MQYFTEQALTNREVLDKIKVKYGEQARILNKKSVMIGGFLGIFAKEGIEMSGYVPQDQPKRQILNLEEEKRKILESVNKDSALQVVLKEIKEIKASISSSNGSGKKEEHSTITKIQHILTENDFSFPYISNIIDTIKRDCTLEELDNFGAVQNKVAELIGENIAVYRDEPLGNPGIFILVGPTGVGKTTTIAKLAAMYGVGTADRKPVSVRMLTADNYRIGAKKQIETYGEIMGIPVACIETSQDLKKKIALFSEADLILLDTIGKSPKDFVKLAEMRELIDSCIGSSTTHLAVSATTKTSDLFEILQQFESFNYASVVLTKLDETMRVGNIISVFSEKNKPISYITDGQGVPQDIEKATAYRLLKHISGLTFDRDKLEQKFGG